MGAKAWFIAYFKDDPKKLLANGPVLDRVASRQLAERLFPDSRLAEIGDGELGILNPDKDQLFVGCYGGLRIVAHEELAGDYPSRINRRWLDPALGVNAYVHATHSVVDWAAFGLWREGRLVRSVSVSPDNGIQEQIGEPLAFEKPFWCGEKQLDVEPDEEPYPLPFHPLEFSEAAMLHQLGFQFEGDPREWVCDPYAVPILKFELKGGQAGNSGEVPLVARSFAMFRLKLRK